jgi:hypothetical protein
LAIVKGERENKNYEFKWKIFVSPKMIGRLCIKFILLYQDITCFCELN